jgi:hypothetical protein
MKGCNCTSGLGNTGVANCVPLQSVTSKLVLVPLRKSDGTLNYIDLTANFIEWNGTAYADAQSICELADPSVRWFPLPNFENVEMPKEDSLFEEASSGRKVFLRSGKRGFMGELWADDSSPALLKEIQNARCVDFGVYNVDINGSLVGLRSEDSTKLYPIKVDNASWDAQMVFATDTTIQKIKVSFDFDRNIDEGLLYMVTDDENTGTSFLSLEGLQAVTIANTTLVAGTTIVVDVTGSYGTAYTPQRITGLTILDFTVFKNGASQTIATVLEGVAGTYTITIPTFVSGVTLEVNVLGNGYTGSLTKVVA